MYMCEIVCCGETYAVNALLRVAALAQEKGRRQFGSGWCWEVCDRLTSGEGTEWRWCVPYSINANKVIWVQRSRHWANRKRKKGFVLRETVDILWQ
jgi:hypothetical protein